MAGSCPTAASSVFVGDSSALNDLPLQGDFVVTRTVGARYVTVSAPTTINAGGTGIVSVTLVNNGDFALHDAQFELGVPSGWTASIPAPVTVGAGKTVTEQFQVTPRAGAKPGTSTLTGQVTARRITGRHGARPGNDDDHRAVRLDEEGVQQHRDQR